VVEGNRSFLGEVWQDREGFGAQDLDEMSI